MLSESFCVCSYLILGYLCRNLLFNPHTLVAVTCMHLPALYKCLLSLLRGSSLKQLPNLIKLDDRTFDVLDFSALLLENL